jgi:hypothetical protein
MQTDRETAGRAGGRVGGRTGGPMEGQKRAEGQTDSTKLTHSIRNFVKAPKMVKI